MWNEWNACSTWFERNGRRRPEVSDRGFTVLELLVAMTITLLTMLGVYAFIDSGVRDYAAITDMASAQAAGRAAADILGSEVLVAGYSPLGAVFDAVPQGDDHKIRLLADLDGDGVVGTASESNENITYLFSDPDGDGVYELLRGVDLNGDGDFTDTGETVDSIAEEIVPIDGNGDGTPDPFFAYDRIPPGTRKLTVAFGVRTARRDPTRMVYLVTPFLTQILLRNRR